MEKIDVYIDESGVSRKVGYSVYCLVLLPKIAKIVLDEKISAFEQKHKISPFHWREQSWNIKLKFLHFTKKIDSWNCLIAVVDNKKHPFVTPEQIIAKALLGNLVGTMYIDGKKTRKYIHAVKQSLKESGLQISKLKMVRSSSCGGLRIADSVAGLFRRSLEGKLEPESEEILDWFTKNKISAQVISGYLSNPPHGR